MGSASTREIQKKPAVQRKDQEQTETLQKQEGHAHPNGEVNLNRSIISGNPVQAKLTMGSVGDKFEQEADETADKVMSKTMNGSFSGGAAEDESPALNRKSFLQTQQEETPEVSQKTKEDRISQQKFLQTTLYNEDKDTKNDMVNAMADETISKQDFLQTVLYDEEKGGKNDMVNAKEDEAIQSKEDDALQQKGEEEEETVQQMSDEETVQSKEEEESVQMMEEEESVQSKSEEETIQRAESEEEVYPLTKGDGAAGSGKKGGNVQKKEDEDVQASGGFGQINAEFEDKLSSSKGKGSKMSPEIKSEMESGFGTDFSDVNIHTDSGAAEMSKDIGAKAFTNKSDIYFNSGQYDDSSTDGKKLIAHELTHTIQQGAVPSGGDTVQRKPEDHKVDSDGDNVKKRAQKDAEEESGEDINFNKTASAKEKADSRKEVDYEEKSKQKGRIKGEGLAKPDVDRPGNEKPKVESAAKDTKEKLEEDPKKEGGEKEQEEEPRADMTAVDEKELSAVNAFQSAEMLKRPKDPKPLKSPRLEKPVDKTGEPIPADAALDQNVRALHEIAKLFVENSGNLKQEAHSDRKEGRKLRGELETNKAKTESVKAGSKLAKEDKAAREEVDAQVAESHTKNVENVDMVKKEAPKMKSKADEGNDEGGPMVKEAKAKKKEMVEEETEESGADEKQQQKETSEVADGSLKMDSAFSASGARAEKYNEDALQGEKKNTQSKANLDENKKTMETTQGEIDRIDTHNAESEAQIAAYDHYPEQVEQETLARAESADELYTAAVIMNDQLIDTQEEYYNAMSQVPGKEEAEKILAEEEEAAAAAPVEEEQPLTPEEELLLELGQMPEEQVDATLATMSEEELMALESSLAGMETQEEAGDDDEEELPEGLTRGEDSRFSFDMNEALFGKNEEQGPQDPRARWYQPIEERRALRIGEVKKVSDANFEYLSKEQKQMLAQKLAMTEAVSGVFDIDILEMGKGMIMGMINPVESLKGVIQGANKMIGGIANLFNAEAWAKDPLGNLLTSASDIATGLTTIFMSITGLATAITIIMGALTIASFGTMAWLTGPVISFMASVITTVGGWTIVTGLIALALNALSYMKNLNDAGNAENTDELLAESTALKENMTDAAGNLMAVVGAKGDVAGAKLLKKNIMKGGGAKAFQKTKAIDFKKSMKQAPGKIVKGVKSAPGKIKKMTTGGVQKVKGGIKKTLDRFKKSDKGGKVDKPPKVDAEVPDKVKTIKDKDPNTAKKGGMKTAKDGNLGSVDGKKVKAEMDFPDGHKAKALEDGQCAICTTCQKIKSKYSDEIALKKNKEMVDELGDIETRIKDAGDTPDPADIKRQKEIHDELELQKRTTDAKAEYDATVKNGTLDEARIRQEIEAGKVFDPKTKRFKKAPKGNPIDDLDFADVGNLKVCFPAGTLVDTSTGKKAIENIRKGDLVNSYNHKSKLISLKPVINLFTTHTETLIRIQLSNGEIINSTPKHRFWESKSRDWVQAGFIDKSMELMSRNGESMAIAKIDKVDTQITTYNIEVKDNHNYFVGNSSILVHNASSYLNPQKTAIEFYQIVDKSGNVVYVGQTQSNIGVDKRFDQHIAEGQKKGGWKKALASGQYEVKLVTPPGRGVEMTKFQAHLTEQKLIKEHGGIKKNGGALENKINAMSDKKFKMVKKKATADPDLFKKLYNPNMC